MAMNTEQAIEVMRASFANLTETQRGRLAWHAEKRTPILCGDNASDWTYHEGPWLPPGSG